MQMFFGRSMNILNLLLDLLTTSNQLELQKMILKLLIIFKKMQKDMLPLIIYLLILSFLVELMEYYSLEIGRMLEDVKLNI